MSVKRGPRGQALLELAIALPVVLLALFGIIYVSRLGVVDERTQLALRYGGIASFQTGTSAYSAANIYANLNPSSIPQPCPTPATSVYSDSAPFPGPSSAPFWQPDAQSTATPCTPAIYGFGGAQFLASHYVSATTLAVSASVDVPSYLQNLIGNSQSVSTSASFVHPAFPGIIMYCSTEVANRVYDAITASGTATFPTPIPNGAPTPTPGPTNNGTCR